MFPSPSTSGAFRVTPLPIFNRPFTPLPELTRWLTVSNCPAFSVTPALLVVTPDTEFPNTITVSTASASWSV